MNVRGSTGIERNKDTIFLSVKTEGRIKQKLIGNIDQSDVQFVYLEWLPKVVVRKVCTFTIQKRPHTIYWTGMCVKMR